MRTLVVTTVLGVVLLLAALSLLRDNRSAPLSTPTSFTDSTTGAEPNTAVDLDSPEPSDTRISERADDREEVPSTSTAEQVPGAIDGELFIPTAWNVQTPNIIARPVGWLRWGVGKGDHYDAQRQVELTYATRDVRAYSFRIGALAPGMFDVVCETPPMCAQVEVRSGQSARVRLEGPFPVRVVVHTVDADSQSPVPVRGVDAFPLLPDGSFGRLRTRGAYETASKTVPSLCIPGETMFIAYGDGDFGYGKLIAHVALADQQVVLPVWKLARVNVRFVLSGEPYRMPADTLKVRRTDGAGARCSIFTSSNNSGPTIELFEPGRYAIGVIGPLTGAVTPPEHEVDVKAGTTTDIMIALTKK